MYAREGRKLESEPEASGSLLNSCLPEGDAGLQSPPHIHRQREHLAAPRPVQGLGVRRSGLVSRFCPCLGRVKRLPNTSSSADTPQGSVLAPFLPPHPCGSHPFPQCCLIILNNDQSLQNTATHSQPLRTPSRLTLRVTLRGRSDSSPRFRESVNSGTREPGFKSWLQY